MTNERIAKGVNEQNQRGSQLASFQLPAFGLGTLLSRAPPLRRAGRAGAGGYGCAAKLRHLSAAPAGWIAPMRRRGVCGVGAEPVIASWNVHMWEEPPISGTRGSGTIFFSGCTGKCRLLPELPDQPVRLRQPGEHRALRRDDAGAAGPRLSTTSTSSPPPISSRRSWPRWTWPRAGPAHPAGLQHQRLRDGGDAAPAGGRDRHLAARCQVHRRRCRPAHLRLSALRGAQPGGAAARSTARWATELLLDEEGIARRGMIIRHLVLPDGLAGTPRRHALDRGRALAAGPRQRDGSVLPRLQGAG